MAAPRPSRDNSSRPPESRESVQQHLNAAAKAAVPAPRLTADGEPNTAGPWWYQAACRGRFDLDWIEPNARERARCKAICQTCPVQTECLRQALTTGEAWGIWGGLDVDERLDLAAADGYPIPLVLPPHGTNPRYAKHNCRCTLCRQAHTIHERNRRARTQDSPPAASES